MANFVDIFHGGISETVNTDNIDRMFPPLHHNKKNLSHFCVKVLFNNGNEIDYIFLDDEIGKKEAQALYDKLRGNATVEECKHDGSKALGNRGFICSKCHKYLDEDKETPETKEPNPSASKNEFDTNCAFELTHTFSKPEKYNFNPPETKEPNISVNEKAHLKLYKIKDLIKNMEEEADFPIFHPALVSRFTHEETLSAGRYLYLSIKSILEDKE